MSRYRAFERCLLFGLFVGPLVSAVCYFPNGTATIDWFQPCPVINGSHSMCCALNRANPSKCLPNGLCRDPYGIIYRESCSDPTWESPNCLRDICIEQTDFLGNAQMTPCEDGSFCCGVTNKTCCDNKLGTMLAATMGISTSTTPGSSPSPTSGSNPMSISTTTPAPAGSPGDGVDTSGDLSTPAKVGIGIAVPVIALLALNVSLMVYIHKHRNRPGEERHRRENDEEQSPTKPELSSASFTPPPPRPPSPPPPVPPKWPTSDERRHELIGKQVIIPAYELSGNPPSKYNFF